MENTRENTYVIILTITAGLSAILYLIFDRMIGGMLGIDGWPVIAADIFLIIFTMCLLIGSISSIRAFAKSKEKNTSDLSSSIILSAATIAFAFFSCLRVIALL